MDGAFAGAFRTTLRVLSSFPCLWPVVTMLPFSADFYSEFDVAHDERYLTQPPLPS